MEPPPIGLLFFRSPNGFSFLAPPPKGFLESPSSFLANGLGALDEPPPNGFVFLSPPANGFFVPPLSNSPSAKGLEVSRFPLPAPKGLGVLPWFPKRLPGSISGLFLKKGSFLKASLTASGIPWLSIASRIAWADSCCLLCCSAGFNGGCVSAATPPPPGLESKAPMLPRNNPPQTRRIMIETNPPIPKATGFGTLP